MIKFFYIIFSGLLALFFAYHTGYIICHNDTQPVNFYPALINALAFMYATGLACYRLGGEVGRKKDFKDYIAIDIK